LKKRKKIKHSLRQIFPPVVWRGAGWFKQKVRPVTETVSPTNLIKRNSELKDIFKGKRIFILGTGPSIKTENLKALASEICIGLNEFHLHPDYSFIKPAFMVFSGFYDHPVVADRAVDWYKNYESRTQGISKVILNASDLPMLEEKNLMQGSDNYFAWYSRSLYELHEFGFRHEDFSYLSQSVSIMALQFAIYMGASEVYLLGHDLDAITTAIERRQNHFYTDEQSIIYKNQETNHLPILDEYLRPYVRMFEQYELIKQHLEKLDGTRIYNATRRSFLDVFEKRYIEDILNRIEES
jgi:hypothetical protein